MSSNIRMALNSGNGVSPLMYVTSNDKEWEPGGANIGYLIPRYHDEFKS